MAVGTTGAIRDVPSQAGIFGQGATYPLAFDAAGRLKLSAGPVLVDQALQSIAQTQPGERPMQPDYGAGVLNFEPLDEDRVRLAFDENIREHEPRVAAAEFSARMGTTFSDGQITIKYVARGEANARTLTAGFFAGPQLTNADGST